MAKLDILEYPDPMLRQTARPVTQFDAQLEQLTDNLKDTLYATSGIGLCAPQVGHSVQLLVMDLSDNHTKPEVFINPTLVSKSGLAIAEEQCLSIPGIAAKVMRAGVVQVRAYDVMGKEFERELEGMSAICLQHEIDHLNGMLFIDRLSKLRRFRFRRILRALENNEASLQSA